MRFRALLLCVVLAGCGGDDKPAGTPEKSSADQNAVRAVAQRYLDAVADKNWKAVCATRAAAERAELAKAAGSCEKAFAALLGKQPVALFAGAKAASVRIKGDLAGVDISPTGQKKQFLALAAVREDGGWKLKDVPEAKLT